MKLNGIIEAALAAHIGSVCLVDGKVEFQIGNESQHFDASPTDYDELWQSAHALELRDCRAMATQLLPEVLQQEWTLRVYVGPNAFGKINVVIDPLPKHCKTLSDYIDLLNASN